MTDISKAERRQSLSKKKKQNFIYFKLLFKVKIVCKKLELIKEEAWKLTRVDQNEELSDLDDYLDNETSDFEEHEEISYL